MVVVDRSGPGQERNPGLGCRAATATRCAATSTSTAAASTGVGIRRCCSSTCWSSGLRWCRSCCLSGTATTGSCAATRASAATTTAAGSSTLCWCTLEILGRAHVLNVREAPHSIDVRGSASEINSAVRQAWSRLCGGCGSSATTTCAATAASATCGRGCAALSSSASLRRGRLLAERKNCHGQHQGGRCYYDDDSFKQRASHRNPP